MYNMANALSRVLGSGALSGAALGINDKYTTVYNKPRVMLGCRVRYMTMVSYIVHKTLDNDLCASDSSLIGLKSNGRPDQSAIGVW